jgi:hypothetical protein
MRAKEFTLEKQQQQQVDEILPALAATAGRAAAGLAGRALAPVARSVKQNIVKGAGNLAASAVDNVANAVKTKALDVGRNLMPRGSVGPGMPMPAATSPAPASAPQSNNSTPTQSDPSLAPKITNISGELKNLKDIVGKMASTGQQTAQSTTPDDAEKQADAVKNLQKGQQDAENQLKDVKGILAAMAQKMPQSSTTTPKPGTL